MRTSVEEGRAREEGDALLLCSWLGQCRWVILVNIREWIGDPVTIPKGDQALALNAEQRSVL